MLNKKCEILKEKEIRKIKKKEVKEFLYKFELRVIEYVNNKLNLN